MRNIDGGPYNPQDPSTARPDGTFAAVDPSSKFEGWTPEALNGPTITNCTSDFADLTIGAEETIGVGSLSRNSIEQEIHIGFEAKVIDFSVSVAVGLAFEKTSWNLTTSTDLTTARALPFSKAYQTARLYRHELTGYWWVQYKDPVEYPDGTGGKVVAAYIPDRIGVPQPGWYREILNTDSTFYGGSNVGNPGGGVMTDGTPLHGRPCSVSLVLPPLATLLLEHAVA